MNEQVNHLWVNGGCMSSACIHLHKQNATLQHLGPTSRAVTPLCWWCQPDQRAAACWDHPHPRRAGPLGPPQGAMSGPNLSGTWGDRTQETSTPINSSLPSKPRHWSASGSMSQDAYKTFYQSFLCFDMQALLSPQHWEQILYHVQSQGANIFQTVFQMLCFFILTASGKSVKKSRIFFLMPSNWYWL